MNKKSLDKLEFYKICKIVADFAITYIGKNYANELTPFSQKKDIEKAQKQTSEALTLLYRLGSVPILDIADITVHLKKLENSQALSAKMLLELSNILQVSQNLKKYFSSEVINSEDFPNLINLFENLYSNPSIIREITNSILEDGSIDDNASSTLKSIRQNIYNKEAEIRKKLNSLLHSKYIQEPIITIRNNRFVVPVKNEYRSEVKGFVHDTSASGSTAFIEPIAIFDINNEINNLINSENIEIEKILQKLSSLFFNQTENMQNTVNIIGLLDFIFAKAKFSKDFDCTEPIINDEKFINLINCYHPLIPQNKAVKNSINLGKDFTSLIITGPNTGGKTVILKTVGLLNIMCMAGLHIPAKTGSSIFPFDEIFADIGDEQSIADSLSTFSSHITNIATILQKATQNSLILVDELGSGTDPIEGSSLAIALLEHWNKSNILTIATTHYHEIKNYALVTDGFENACVDFNFDTLSPTYKLLLGVPGRSNAFIISEKLGILESIINRAKEFIKKDTVSVEELLNSIYNDKSLIEEEKSKIDAVLCETEALKMKYQTNYDNLQKKASEIIENAKIKAREILLEAKEDANYIIKELENKASAKKSNDLRKNLNNKIDDLSIPKNATNKKPIRKEDIQIGLNVKIPHLNQTGTIISNISKDNTVMVQIGIIKTAIKIDDLSILT